MAKNQQHYVPRFYLRAFGVDEKQISLYNVVRQKTVIGASLKHQCQKHKYYGDDDVENATADLETITAPVIRSILTNDTLPAKGTKDYRNMLIFISMQMLRTVQRGDSVNEFMYNFMKAIFDFAKGMLDERSKDKDVELISYKHPYPATFALQFFVELAVGIADLQPVLLCTKNNQFFITSDNPVVLYNKYCERGFKRGGRGVASIGLQIFLPLSPTRLLFLYDPSVYKVTTDRLNINRSLTNKDVNTLNTLQVVNAGENIYFRNPAVAKKVAGIVERGASKRPSNFHGVEKFGTQYDMIVCQHDNHPNLELKLSFVNVFAELRQVPLHARTKMFRSKWHLSKYESLFSGDRNDKND